MDYISTKEAATKWGVSLREVQRLLAQNRIEGAKKYGNYWMIPKGTLKPMDLRVERRDSVKPHKTQQSQHNDNTKPRYLPCVFVSTMIPMRKDNPNITASEIADPIIRIQYEMEINYLSSRYENILSYVNTVKKGSPTYICANAMALSAAVTLCDYDGYKRASDKIREVRDKALNQQDVLYAEAALATAAVSIFDPESVPDWLKRGDFSAFPPESRPWLSYVYAKRLQNMHRYESMLVASQSALELLKRSDTFTTADIYLYILCASACSSLGDDVGAEKYLSEILDITMPCGFIAPFIETITVYGASLGKCLLRDWPEQFEQIMNQPEDRWKGWLSFHNKLSRDNLTLVLNMREYHLAQILARGESYAEAAERLHMSQANVKKLASSIYSKLYIKGKGQLAPFLM